MEKKACSSFSLKGGFEVTSFMHGNIKKTWRRKHGTKAFDKVVTYR